MSDFGTLKAQIASDMERTLADDAMNDETWDDVIGRFLNDSIRLLKSRPWWFLQGPTTGSYTSVTTLGNSYVSEYTGLIDLYSLRITIAGQLQELPEVSFTRMEANYDGNSTNGQPIEYTRFAGRVRLWPPPNDAYTLTWSGTFDQSTLTLDADTNDWCVEGSVVLKAQTKVKLYRDYIKDLEAASAAVVELNEGVRALDTEHMRRTGNNRIQPGC